MTPAAVAHHIMGKILTFLFPLPAQMVASVTNPDGCRLIWGCSCNPDPGGFFLAQAKSVRQRKSRLHCHEALDAWELSTGQSKIAFRVSGKPLLLRA